jgi:AraC family transcriptional regulator of adaptative response/methylated-DNA-[protein]-cysteine methyltransferase
MTNTKNIRETIEIGAWLHTRPQVRYGIVSTPFGNVVVSAVDGILAGLVFCDNDADGIADIAAQWPGAVLVEDAKMADATAREVFADGDVRAPAVGLAMIGTGFQISVWERLMDIPRGTVETYSDVARRIGRPEAVRAVATAIGRNPMAILVPCHRVVPKAGGLGAYRWGSARKRLLINRENTSR